VRSDIKPAVRTCPCFTSASRGCLLLWRWPAGDGRYAKLLHQLARVNLLILDDSGSRGSGPQSMADGARTRCAGNLAVSGLGRWPSRPRIGRFVSRKCYSARRPDDRRAKLVVAPGWIQTEMGGSEATHTVEECIPLVADMLETNHGKPGLRYVDRLDKTPPW
jgi:hypothetical protein